MVNTKFDILTQNMILLYQIMSESTRSCTIKLPLKENLQLYILREVLYFDLAKWC